MDGDTLAARLRPFRDRRRWWVAYSGGLDSHVLLDLCSRVASATDWPQLAAIHINHQLNPAADRWADHCRKICQQLCVPLTVIVVDVRPAGHGIEAAARAARYAAFETVMSPGDLLLQAHHADDQAETVLLRLLRGSAPTQLSAIPEGRPLGLGELFRPLLSASRAEIEVYARARGLAWVEDDSNRDHRFDRNYLRHSVIPRLAHRWPNYRDALGQVTRQAGDTAALLDELAATDLAACSRADRLIGEQCRTLSSPRLENLLRYWLRSRSLPAPTGGQLQQVARMLIAAADKEPVVGWPGAEVRRFRDCLYAMTPLPAFAPWHARLWDPNEPAALPSGGRLLARSVTGTGLRQGLPLELRSRRGGERCRPSGRAHSQTLRRLLQEYEVPPWWRDRLPLIYSGGELVAVADLWICEGYQARTDEVGLSLEWQTL